MFIIIIIIIIIIVSSSPVHGEMYSIHQYVIKFCQWLATGRWFSPDTPVSSTNKTDRHDIQNVTEILLKVALNSINQTKYTVYYYMNTTVVIK